MEKMIKRKVAAAFLGISIATLDSARINGQISYVQYKHVIRARNLSFLALCHASSLFTKKEILLWPLKVPTYRNTEPL